MDLLLIPRFVVNLTEIKSFSSPPLSKIFALIISVTCRCNIEIIILDGDPTSSSKDQLRFYVHSTFKGALSMSFSTSPEGALVQMSTSTWPPSHIRLNHSATCYRCLSLFAHTFLTVSGE